MDNYFGFREQVKNYYLEMALAKSGRDADLLIAYALHFGSNNGKN